MVSRRVWWPVVLVVVIMVSVLPVAAQTGLQVGGVAVVSGVAPDPLNARAEPSTSAAKVLALPEGTRVQLLVGGSGT